MSKLNLSLLFIFFFALIGGAICQQKQSDFIIALNKHLNAIETKNLADISATVADSVTLVFPDGEVLKSKSKFVEMHQNWFKDSLWKINAEVLKTIESKSIAYAHVKYKYNKFKTDGTKLSETYTYLVLIFTKEKNAWKVIHDQNTKITL